MKHILVTDSHLGVKQGSVLYNDITERLFDTIIHYAQAHDIISIKHLGDFFDNRKSITIKSIISAIKIIRRINRYFSHTSFIIGNHDTIYKDTLEGSLLTMFDKYENINIIKEPTVENNILMLPWLFPISELNNDSNNMILLGHFDIAGATMNESGTVSIKGLNQSMFKNWKMVLSGHFHTPGKYGNIQYLGSPFHTSFNDVAGVRGFYVLDDEDISLEFVEFNNYPKFVRVKDTDTVIEDNIKGNIVEIIFTKDHGISGNIAILERFKNAEPLSLTPKYINIDSTMSDDKIEEDIEISNHFDIFIQYLETCSIPEHLNPATLNKIAEMIYKETIND